MRAPLRGTEFLKSGYSRPPKVWLASPAIWRRGLHISTPSADALDIIPSEPALSTVAATPGPSKIQKSNALLTVF